ncbi:MAG TPA: MFS transporter [Verrucomicrobiae bacterium]|nr:MFS transporter [Verrucomicrobiae bacterium]
MSQLQILYLVSLLMDMSVAGVTFAITRRAAELGASSSDLGWLAAVWIGVYGVLVLLTGHVSDRVGRRKLAVIGCLAASAMTLACSFTTRIPLLLVFSAGIGAGIACFWPTIIAWLGEGPGGAHLAKRLTTFGVVWNAGLLLGYGSTGVIFKHGPHAAFYVSAGVILTIAALLLLPVEGRDGPPGRPSNPARPAARSRAVDGVAPYQEPHVTPSRDFRKTAWLALFATNFALNGTSAMFPELATHLGIGADVHGGLLAAGRGAALAAFVALSLLTFWRMPRHALSGLWIAQLCCAASIAWIGFADPVWMFAAAWVIGGATSGYAYQASIYFTLEEMTEKGKGSGFHEAMVGSGMFFGPMLAGWVGNHHSLRAPYFFCAATLVTLVGVQMLLVLFRRKTAVVLHP